MVYIVLGILAVILLIWTFSGFSMIQEYQKGVVFILGHFKGVRGPGVVWLPRGISRIMVVDTRTRTVDVDAQDTVTRDSVTIRVNAVLYYRILDPKKAI